jgi:hypothetical protein
MATMQKTIELTCPDCDNDTFGTCDRCNGLGKLIYIEGKSLPNIYNKIAINPTWRDSESQVSPNLTLKETIIRDYKMHAVAIVNIHTRCGAIMSKQIVTANWDYWKQLLC